MSRLKAKVRKEQLLNSAVILSHQKGFTNVTRQDIARHAEVSEGLVSMHWGTMEQMRRSLVRHAVIVEDLQIIAQGLAARHPAALKASDQLKQKAAKALATA